MSSLSPLPLGGVSVQVAGRRRRHSRGMGVGSDGVQVSVAGQMPEESMGPDVAGRRRRHRSRRAGQEPSVAGRRRRSRRAGQNMNAGQEPSVAGRRRSRSRRAGQEAGRRHRSRKH